MNIPPMPEGGYKGYSITTQSTVRGGEEGFAQTTHPGSGRTIYWNVFREGATGPQGTDVWALENGMVSVTPMKLGEMDATQVETLRGIFK